VPVLYAGAESFGDVLSGLELVGTAIDRKAEGEEAAARTENELKALTVQLPGARPRTLILNGAPEDFFAAKPESYAGDLARLLGAENVAANTPDVGRFPGYTKLSVESIVAAQPDVVLAITAGPPGGRTISEELSSNPAWASVPAVQNGRVHEISLQVYLQAPGPRASEAIDEMSRLLYPELFSQ
jgi:iron complex transport system substrate-binding protein